MPSTEIAEKTDPKCEQIDCPMRTTDGHCIAYKDYEWETFGTKECLAQTKLLDSYDYWGRK